MASATTGIIRRSLEPVIRRALGRSPVVFLAGARQTGKSTLVQQLIAEGYPARYRTLDDLTTLAAASQNPAGFASDRGGVTLVIDEVQRAPELLLPIKATVDRDRKPGLFLLTGSANVLLLPKVAENLVGRREVHTLQPLSQGEIAGREEQFVARLFGERLPEPGTVDRATLARMMEVGGYPESLRISDDEDREVWFSNYAQRLTERDVRDLADIEGLTNFPRLFGQIAARTTSLLNLASLARDVGLPQTTLRRYFSLLEHIFLIELLPAWSTNVSTRFVKAPKLYLNDTGLLCALLGINESRLLADSSLFAHVLEQFVISEIRRQLSWGTARAKLFHFRTTGGAEVDLVLENAAGSIVGIEVKSTNSLNWNDGRGLRTLAELAGDRFHRGIILYLGESVLPFGDRIHTMPISALWTTGIAY